jgi:uncharacterized protein YbbC (DUF1343 family)
MIRIKLLLSFIIISRLFLGKWLRPCFAQAPKKIAVSLKKNTVKPIIPAADQVPVYIDYLRGKNIGMLINQTSVIGSKKIPLVDSLLKLGIGIKKIYGPEHGFRGNASDGATIDNTIDSVTGLPAISLYGKHNKPTVRRLKRY